MSWTRDGQVVVTARGELDVASCREFAQELEAIEAAAKVVIDLRGVSFMDSTGLATLARSELRLRRLEAEVVLVVGSGRVRDLLELTGVISQFSVVESIGTSSVSSGRRTSPRWS